MTTDPHNPSDSRVDFLRKRYKRAQKEYERKHWDCIEDLDKNVALTAAREKLKPKDVIVKKAPKAKEARQIPPSDVNPEFPRPPGYGEARGWSTEPIYADGDWWRYRLTPYLRKRRSDKPNYVLVWIRVKKRNLQGKGKEYLEHYTYPGFNKNTPPPEVLVYLRGGGQGYSLNRNISR